MRLTTRMIAAGIAALTITTVAAAQSSPPNPMPPGVTAGTGARVVDLSTPQPAETLGQSPASDGAWGVIAPYAWIFRINGAVGVGQRTVQVDQSLSDAFNSLKDMRGAAQLHLEGGYGAFGLIADLTYINIAPGLGPVTFDSHSTLFEMLGMYRVVNSNGVTLDVLGGARYYRFHNELTGAALGIFSADRTEDWIDMVVGARAAVQVTDALGVFVRGDVGGFGVGHSSKHACNFLTGFEYKCCECTSLVGGYRWLNIDRENGVGPDRFLLNATLSGPFAALVIRY